MFNTIISTVRNVTGIIKNLNLTKEQVIIIICIIVAAGTAWSATHYRSKAAKFEAALLLASKASHINRDQDKVDKNKDLKAAAKLVDEEIRKELEELRAEYNILANGTKLVNHTERLKDVKTVEDICKEVDAMGYSICDDITSDCPR